MPISTISGIFPVIKTTDRPIADIHVIFQLLMWLTHDPRPVTAFCWVTFNNASDYLANGLLTLTLVH